MFARKRYQQVLLESAALEECGEEGARSQYTVLYVRQDVVQPTVGQKTLFSVFRHIFHPKRHAPDPPPPQKKIFFSLMINIFSYFCSIKDMLL